MVLLFSRASIIFLWIFKARFRLLYFNLGCKMEYCQVLNLYTFLIYQKNKFSLKNQLSFVKCVLEIATFSCIIIDTKNCSHLTATEKKRKTQPFSIKVITNRSIYLFMYITLKAIKRGKFFFSTISSNSSDLQGSWKM